MLKTILNFKGVEVLSAYEQKYIISGATRCTEDLQPFPYDSPCVMLSAEKLIEPICKITIDGIVCN